MLLLKKTSYSRNFSPVIFVPSLKTNRIFIMKKIGLIILLITTMFRLSGQEVTKEKQNEKQIVAVTDTNENTKVVVGKDLISVEDRKDAVKVRVGNRGLNILESLEGPKIAFEKYIGNDNSNESDENDQDNKGARRRSHFKGHWSGIEFGFNNYVTSDRSMVLPSDIDYMNLQSSISNNFNINFSQLSLGFTRHFGIVTGLGINWNNYKFDGNNNIQKGNDGMIEVLDPGFDLKKSKLATIYLTLPVMFEIQIPADYHRLNIAGGFIGAIRLDSHTKMVFKDGNDVKSYGDFNLNMLRYGATVRVGYQNFQIYGTYYKTPLFKTGLGPGGYDLYPFEIGFALTFNG
jgi:hypothetical protein